MSNKERNTGIRDNISYLSKAMDGNEEDSSEVGKAKSLFLENYKDILFSKQINSTGMFSTPHVLNIGTPILIMPAIAVLEVHVHLQNYNWIHMKKRF